MSTEPTPTVLYLHDGPDGIRFRWRTADAFEFEELRCDLRRVFPAGRSGLRFDAEAKAWWLPADQRDSFQMWARGWFSAQDTRAWEPNADTSKDDPRGRTHRSDGASDHAGQRGGRQRTGPGGRRAGHTRATQGDTSVLAQAYSTLHLREDAPLWAAEAVYRAAQKQGHPDVGGSHADAVAVNRAIAVIREAHSGRASGAA